MVFDVQGAEFRYQCATAQKLQQQKLRSRLWHMMSLYSLMGFGALSVNVELDDEWRQYLLRMFFNENLCGVCDDTTVDRELFLSGNDSFRRPNEKLSIF